MNRREFFNLIGAGAIGAIGGYIAGAREMLGIQQETVRLDRNRRTTPQPTPTATQQPTDSETNPGTDTETSTEPPTTGSPESRLATSGFPRFHYDNRNVGYTTAEGPTGSVSAKWRFSTQANNHTTPVVADNVAYFGGGGDDPHVYAVDATTGSEVWRATLGEAVQSSAVIGEDRIYIPNGSGTLYALRQRDGTEVWKASYGKASYVGSPLLVSDRIYVGDPETGGIYGFDTRDGTEVWSVSTDGAVGGSPAYANGTLFIGTQSATVSAVDIQSGSVRWKYDASGEVRGAPTVADETVYITAATGQVTALDAVGGEQLWTTSTDQPIQSSVAVDGDSVYVGDGELFESPGKLYSLAQSDGTVQWEFDTEGSYGGRKGAIIRSPTVASGVVYFGVDGNKVYAVNAADGSREWVFGDIGVVLSSPAIHDGTVYIGNDSNSVYALE